MLKLTHNLMRVAVVVVTFIAAASTQTVTCPPQANEMVVTVRPTTSFDPSTKLFTYSYTVTNSSSSQQEVADFAIFFSPAITSISTPQGWGSLFMGLSQTHDPSVLHWNAVQTAPDSPDQPPDGIVKPGLFQIKPGTSVSGFAFQSTLPPGPVKYFVRGFVPQFIAQAEAEAEAIGDLCPPETAGDFFDKAVMGTTLGPVSFIPVNIQIKPGATPPVPLNPQTQGVVPVAVLGTATFDASTIAPDSLRLGPGDATPRDGAGHLEDVNGDGLPDMVVQFTAQDIGVHCSDTALFLVGSLKNGTRIQGSEAIKTPGCNPQRKVTLSGQPMN